MPHINTPNLAYGLTYEQAVAAGHDVWEVFYRDWGMLTTDSIPSKEPPGTATSFILPGLPVSPKGIMIGPRSTVDRVWCSWNNRRSVPTSPGLLTRPLTVDSPLLFSQPAGEGVPTALQVALYGLLGAGQTLGSIFIGPQNAANDTSLGVESTVPPLQYMRATGGVIRDFWISEPGLVENIMTPNLHLRFILKDNVPMLPIRRAPLMMQRTQSEHMALGVERRPFAFPVYGRKKISLSIRSDATAATYQVCALRNTNPSYDDPLPGLVEALQETIEGEKTSTSAFESVKFQFCDLNADWLFVYATQTGVSSGGNNYATPTVSITAYD